MSEIMLSDERPSKRARLSPDTHSRTEISSRTAEKTTMNAPASLTNSIDDTKEIEVGITEYVSDDVVAFSALLKVRYTDFVVNEILPNGEVIHLNDTSVPKMFASSGPPGKKRPDKSSQQKEPGSDGTSKDGQSTLNGDAAHSVQTSEASKPEQQKQINSTESGDVSEEDKNQLISFLNEEAVGKLLELYKDVLKHPGRKGRDHGMVRTEFTDDRSVRAQVHGTIRRVFASKIESSTDHDGFLCLTANKSQGGRSNNNNSRTDGSQNAYPGKLGWLERGGEYLHFTLYKENKDTMEAISFLTRQLKLNAKVFQFAGTKDKRAICSQRVSAYRLDAERLAKQNYHLRGAAIGDFEYKPSGLALGDLGGNEFVLTLRECQFAGLPVSSIEDALPKFQSALDLALSNLRSKGFLNYYGLQRFGTFSTRTDTIGVHILKGDFRSACEALLQYNPDLLAAPEQDASSAAPTPDPNFQSAGRDEIARAKAIQLFQKTGSAHKAIDLLPRKFSAENQLIRHLSRTPTDYVGALLTIPRNLRLMYVHAYQSLIWNKAVSRRWQLYGGAVVEGDLVLIKEHDSEDSNTTTAPNPEPTDVDADGEIIIAPSSHDRSNTLDDMFDRARALSAAEASSGRYSIFDIVLPLPGYDILYPGNASGQFYKDFMASTEGGGLDPYDMRRKQKDFSLSGGYRKVMARIGEGFGVSVHRYQKDEEQFVQTDLERLKARRRQERQDDKKGDGSTGNGDADSEVGGATVEHLDTGAATGTLTDDALSEKIAAVLKFQLGASQYATMALRELSRGGVENYKSEFGGGRG